MTIDTRAADDSSVFDRPAAPAEHTRDDDCYVADSIDATDTCTICGAYHGDPCPDCGGRGYHEPECNHIDEEA